MHGRGKTVRRRLALTLALAGTAALVATLIPPSSVPASAPPVEPAGGLASREGSVGQGQSDFERWFAEQPRVNVPVSRGGAAVIIVKFTDYQCSGCAQTHFGYRPVLAKYEADVPGAVRVVSLDYPLNTECNPGLVRTLHPAACEAAVARTLAVRAGRTQQMEDWLYANQQALTPAAVRQAAASIAGVKDWLAVAPAARETVAANVALGRLLNVRSTPTFFINGVRISDVFPTPASLDAVLRDELRRAGTIR